MFGEDREFNINDYDHRQIALMSYGMALNNMTPEEAKESMDKTGLTRLFEDIDRKYEEFVAAEEGKKGEG